MNCEVWRWGVKTCSESRGSWGESIDPLDPPKRLLYQPCQKCLSLAIKWNGFFIYNLKNAWLESAVYSVEESLGDPPHKVDYHVEESVYMIQLGQSDP